MAAGYQSEPPVHFNVSHTRGLVACVVSQIGEVGIDVERTDRSIDLDALAARFFHESELYDLRHVAEAARPTRFFELWVLKEAYLKGRGVGMTLPLRDCIFEFVEPDGLRFAAADHTTSTVWRFALYAVQADRCRAAVAWTGHPRARVDVGFCGEARADTARLLRISTARC
jgi:4'-phosphopantetheinyl transferase